MTTARAGCDREWTPVWLAAALLALAGAIAVAAAPPDVLLRDLSTDDSFYFAQVARMLAHEGCSSFDGITPTNGYQPLWTWLQVPIHWLPVDPIGALRATRVLEVLLGGLTFLAIALTLRLAGAAPWLTLIPLPFFAKEWVLYSGMEAGVSLMSLAFTGLLLASRSPAPPSGRDGVLLGGALSACFLGRIDNLAFAGAVTALVAAAELRGGRRPAGFLGGLLGTQLALIGGYFAWNALAFDTAVPVSGLVKQFWAASSVPPPLHERVLTLLGIAAVRDGLLYGAGALVVDRLTRSPRESDAAAGIRLFLVALLVLHVAKLAFYAVSTAPPHSEYTWYHVSGKLARWFAIALVVHRMTLVWPGLGALVRSRCVAVLGTAACLAVAIVRGGSASARACRPEPDWEVASFEGARWMAAGLPADARVGSFDAGVLGYFATQRITNLDGLMNSVDYLERVLRGGGFEGYLRAEGIEWICNVFDARVENAETLVRSRVPLPEPVIGRFEIAHVAAAPAVVEHGTPLRFTVIRYRP